jgi:hypothetical protein
MYKKNAILPVLIKKSFRLKPAGIAKVHTMGHIGVFGEHPEHKKENDWYKPATTKKWPKTKKSG